MGTSCTPTLVAIPLSPSGRQALADIPLRKIAQRDIDEEAKRGLDANTRRTQEKIGRRAPAFLAGLSRYAVNIMDRDLKRGGGFTYRIYLFEKD